MSRRRVRPKKPRGSHSEILPPVESKRSGDYYVRKLSGSSSTKTYTCPGCHRPVTPATPHVVVWPVEKALLSEAAIDERRHWHTPCWKREQ